MGPDNAFLKLHRAAVADSTKMFNARGVAVKRCQRCQLAIANCICVWRVGCSAGVDVVLLLHRDEIFKPTNTGRLIADVLPENTYAFEWSRTSPPEELLGILADPKRYCMIIFPGQDLQRKVHRDTSCFPADKKPTLLLLDGTWKQASKMYRSSDWLKDRPLFALPQDSAGQYSVRKASSGGRLATAEAASLALRECGELRAAQVLADYFVVFNAHYVAARLNRLAAVSTSHERLQAFSRAG